MKINKTELSLDLDKISTLIATPDPADAMGDVIVIWKSEYESIAKVDKNGLLTAVEAGTTNIVVQIGEYTAKCSVTVNIPITKVTINPSRAKISVNKTIKLSAITEPGNSTVDKTVTWTTSSSSIATVDKNGVVTSKKAGKSAYCKVTVISEDEEAATSITEEIEKIRNSYNFLTDEQKKYVTNLEKLLKAEETISNLEIEKVRTIISKTPNEITLKISKAGYYTDGKTITVLNVFSKALTANSIKSSLTKISGKGQPGATIRVYVNEKQTGKSVKVSKNGTYSISIPKQKKNTKITIKMSKTATASVEKDIVVKYLKG